MLRRSSGSAYGFALVSASLHFHAKSPPQFCRAAAALQNWRIQPEGYAPFALKSFRKI
jgi:hypothetical protein